MVILNSLDTNSLEKLQHAVGQMSAQVLPSMDVVRKLALHLTSNFGNKEFIGELYLLDSPFRPSRPMIYRFTLPAFFLEDLSQHEAWRQEVS